jgi:hypothetical protein
MGTRRNAKLLSPAERENFVKACVLMKADIVNPAALPADRYSKWDEFNAIHWMIQDAFAPGAASVNFGHGGSGSYSFLSWHRQFLFVFEQQLQSYVPGVMLPYWDWTDPSSIMTDTFLGPNGTISNEVRSGYFAPNAPGTPGNPTPAPAWWPAGLTGWISPAAFGTGSGALRRGLGALAGLPSANDLKQTLAKTTYPAFQNALEGGVGLPSFPAQQMHNGLHGWIGGAVGQMSDPSYSPFDPIFYLHHCNIDRLWTMWQMDGHANVYPVAGGNPHHNRNDIMYPWTGGAAGYGTNAAIAASIPMPDFSAVGAKLNVDTLDFRNAFGVTYDTLAIIGIGLDRTGSMTGLTPDPMTTSAPDVTKWEAAKRGVSAFLQDCETVQSSGVTYVMAGIKTFRRLGAGNDFTPVFSSPGYGLVKNGTSFSRATFDSNIASMTPGGGTPLADALSDVQNTLVEPPFGHVPADEQRYLAMLTDGLLTAGSPMASIPDHSFTQTAIFAMGFGTGADVDYATLASMVAKGKTLSTTQVFHGENLGTIDKFYSNAVAAAIGFTTIFDPVLELFAGEYAHMSFQATSAEDAFFITAQGMDYDDDNWTFHVHGPGGLMVYGDADAHAHASTADHCMPDVTATRATGRLSLMVQRNNADATCWVGTWTLMVAYKARLLDAMLMPSIAELLFPVAAGPARGPRFSRLLIAPKERIATRNVSTKPAHRLDRRSLSTNNSHKEACNAVVNIYARTRLRLSLVPSTTLVALGDAIKVQISSDVLAGTAAFSRSFARLVAPAQDSAALVARVKRADIPNEARLKGADRMTFDSARVLAKLERANPKQAWISDQELPVVSHEGGMLHMHVEKTETAGVYHLGVYVEGAYYPDATSSQAQPGHDHAHGATLAGGVSAPGPGGAESFMRLLNISVPIVSKKKLLAATKPLATKKTRAVKKRRAARKK